MNSSGSYTVRVLHSFGPASLFGGDGFTPLAGLVMDAAGNLYGTTAFGGDWGVGTVFELVNSSGSYTEKVLYSFGANLSISGGTGPMGPLVIDAAGNLYGTAGGGTDGVGVVFELVNSSGSYAEKVLYSFTGPTNGDGSDVIGGLLMDPAGNLYGTTGFGGTSSNCAPSFGCGTLFELVNSSGSYTEKVLHSFTGSPNDAQWPYGSPTMDASGNLYGATTEGGAIPDCSYEPGCGALFELVNTSGVYTEKVLHNFGTFFDDGVFPAGGLVSDPSGNLYGITSEGGTNNEGTVFMLNPAATAPEAELSPVTLRFGDQTVGVTAAAQTVTVTNTGNANLTFGTAP